MVTNERWLQLSAAIVGRESGGRSLCASCRDLIGVTGAGITLMTEESSGLLCVSDPDTGVLEDLQFSLGEGPCVDAFKSGGPVLEPELARHTDRWPAFSGAVLEAGIGAVFAYPLGIGASRIGALTLYSEAAGSLDDEAEATCAAVAEITSIAILDMQAGAPPDALAEGLVDAGSRRAEVHQASGMVAVQLGIRPDEAFVRLRAHAYATGRPLAEVAADVVGRRLRFTER